MNKKISRGVLASTLPPHERAKAPMSVLSAIEKAIISMVADEQDARPRNRFCSQKMLSEAQLFSLTRAFHRPRGR